MSKRRIVACGGGNPTTSSSQHFMAGIMLTGVTKLKLLIVPTPKSSVMAQAKIVGTMTAHYAITLGFGVRVLHEFGELPTPQQTHEALDWADAIYVTGGNTRYMMEQWDKGGLRGPITRAVNRGDVVAIGISAGMLAWFRWTQSDSEQYDVAEGEPWNYSEVNCTGIFDAMAGVHHDGEHPITQQPRKIDFQQRLSKRPTGTIGVAADNSVAMCVVENKMTVLGTDEPGMLHRYQVLEDGKLSTESFAPDTGKELPIGMFSRGAA